MAAAGPAAEPCCKLRPDCLSISAVIPTFNEACALPDTLAHLSGNDGIREVIVVDGGSSDRTVELARHHGCTVLAAPRGRGGQMRAGAAHASGDVVIFLHADTWLPVHAADAVRQCLRDRRVVAGGFWKEFRDPHWLMAGTKWRCGVRCYLGGRVLGDQGLFVRRAVLERIGGVPDVPLMEEYELCARLRREGRLALANAVVRTSARRFHEQGVLRTYWRMGWITLRYLLGTPPDKLRRLYDGE